LLKFLRVYKNFFRFLYRERKRERVWNNKKICLESRRFKLLIEGAKLHIADGELNKHGDLKFKVLDLRRQR